MTPIEQVVADYLETVTAITAVVGTRIYQLKLPQNATFPAIRVQLVSDDLDYHLRGELNLNSARLQVDAYGKEDPSPDPYRRVTDLADLITAALSGIRFTLDNVRVVGAFHILRRALHEPGTQPLIRVHQDFRFRYQRVS